MEQLLIIFDSLLFVLVGYFLGRHHHDPEIGKKVISEIKKFPEKAAVKAGVIEYVSQADIDYTESGEERVDKERERVFQEQFKQNA